VAKAKAKGIRTERTLSVKDQQLNPEQIALLAMLRNNPQYEALLDVCERACIEQETALINCRVSEPESVLAEHALSKAMWKVFTYIQIQVENAFKQYTGENVAREEVPEDEAERRRILGA